MPDNQLDPTTLDLSRRSAAALNADPHADWKDRWMAAAEAGLLSFTMPKSAGGQGATAREHVHAMMELGRLVADNGLTQGLGTHVWTVQQPLVAFGTTAQQDTYLPDLCAGRRIGAYALTEPGSGSDAMGLATRADRTEDGYVLNGEKTYIGMGPCFDMALVFASTAPEKKAWGVSVFLVHGDDPGITREPAQEKLGLKTLPMGKVTFENCHIPADRRLGPEGAGARIFQATLDWERAFILAAHVGAMARQLEDPWPCDPFKTLLG